MVEYNYNNHDMLKAYESIMNQYKDNYDKVSSILDGLVHNKYANVTLSSIVGVKTTDDLKKDLVKYYDIYLEYKDKYEKEQAKRQGR